MNGVFSVYIIHELDLNSEVFFVIFEKEEIFQHLHFWNKGLKKLFQIKNDKRFRSNILSE